MSDSKPGNVGSGGVSRKRPDRAAEVANTFEWLITAFILAFVFRAFVMEAFRIPTGSMADTLKGAHFRLRCEQCGYRYDFGFLPERYGLLEDTVPSGNVRIKEPTRCPSCGHYAFPGKELPVANGDRILVLKCIYQFFEPKQWDVVVFRNPDKPKINYIKRLIGRPGETVEIIDGDVYINGQISRKPPKVQDELWMPVYDNDYQPVNSDEPSFNGHRWQQPFDTDNSGWTIGEIIPTSFRLDSPPDQINVMTYNPRNGNDVNATYAYDDLGQYRIMPYCSDLMLRFYVDGLDSAGVVGAELSKYGIHYKSWVGWPLANRAVEHLNSGTGVDSVSWIVDSESNHEPRTTNHKHSESWIVNRESNHEPRTTNHELDVHGKVMMRIVRVLNGKEQLLNERSIEIKEDRGAPKLVKFANVDHQLIFQFGGDKLIYDLGRGVEDAGRITQNIRPQIKIFGAGKLVLSHLAMFRDVHYIDVRSIGNEPGRATQGNPFKLEKDEFFVLGDNSPNSEDSRFWSRPGKANWGKSYTEGVVPREYLVGKAMFVYWPSGFKPFAGSRVAVIPNVGQMRFIYGGSNR